MSDLFIRTLSQGLQAFVPIACYFLWLRRSGRADVTPAVRAGLAAAVPATLGAIYLFQTTNRLALWESAFATVTTAFAAWFAQAVWRQPGTIVPSGGRHTIRALVVGTATTLVVVRQTAEIGVVFVATAFQLRAAQPTRLVCGAALLALIVAWLCISAGERTSEAATTNAVRTFSIVF